MESITITHVSLLKERSSAGVASGSLQVQVLPAVLETDVTYDFYSKLRNDISVTPVPVLNFLPILFSCAHFANNLSKYFLACH